MFHGTTMNSALNIINTGFDVSYNTVSAYGKGTYASPNIRVALNYCKDAKQPGQTSLIFLCKFLLGEFGIDYCGNKNNIYVTPYNYGIIPTHLFCYYSWNK